MHTRRMVLDSSVLIALGVWLWIAPLVLGYGFVDASVWNSAVVGTMVAVLGTAKAVGQFRNPVWSWLSAALGAWLVVAPFILGYSIAPALLWHAIIIGALIVVLSWRSATASA